MPKGAGTSCCNNIVVAQDDSIASFSRSLYAEDTNSVSVTFLSDIKERDSERS